MPLFSYKARDNDGNLVVGEIEATTINEAKIAISQTDLLPIHVKSKGFEFSFEELKNKFTKPKLRDLIAFTRQFNSMIKSGININRIFDILIKEQTNKNFKNALLSIQNDIRKGLTLSKAFSKQKKYFDSIYTSMLAVGEEGGVLDQSLSELATLLEKQNRITKSVRGATMYPKIILVVVSLVIIVAVTYIVPTFAQFYSKHGATLPLPTRILIGISDVVINFWYFLIGIIIFAFINIKKYIASKDGKIKYDKLRFVIPVFGNLNKLIANAKFAHIMSALYKSGLSIVKSLEIISDAIGNAAFREEIIELKNAVSKGKSLSQGMREQKFFTPMLIESVSVGEESGNLDEMLFSLANFYDEEITYTVENLATLIEPLLLTFIFSIIALIALAVFLPIWNLSKVVLPH
jgi:type II secretory pathway component PulF